jgi:hypothetical protein
MHLLSALLQVQPGVENEAAAEGQDPFLKVVFAVLQARAEAAWEVHPRSLLVANSFLGYRHDH